MSQENVTLEFLARLITDHREETREKLAELRADMETRFERLEQRLDGISARLKRFEEKTELQFQRLEDRVDGLAARIEELRDRVGVLEHSST
jgi:predicted nuclease with TOPRIM domain